MKTKTLFLSLLTLMFPCTMSFAKENVIYGSSNLDKMSFSSLTVYGSLKFHQLTIDDTLSVYGSAHGKNLQCKFFEIHGSFTGDHIKAENGMVYGMFRASDVTIPNQTKVSGNMSISNGTFGDIEIYSVKSSFSHVKAKSILVKKQEILNPILELEHTEISGDVTFESGNGKVYLSNNSKIHGSLKGAIIIKK